MELRGNLALTEEELRIYLRASSATQPGVDVAADAIDLLRDAYRRRGYFTPTIQPVSPSAPEPGAALVLEIDAGPLARVSEREVLLEAPVRRAPGLESTGAPPSSSDAANPWLDELLSGLPCAPGEPFEIAAYERAKQMLLDRLREGGYLAASLGGGADVDVATASVRIAWALRPGPMVLRGASQVDGLVNVTQATIARELEGVDGTPLSARWLEQTQERLTALGWFRSVTVRAGPPDGIELASAGATPAGEMKVAPRLAGAAVETWPVAIRVEERPARSVEAALGYGTDDRVRIRAAWQHRHLLGTGRALRIGARYSSLRSGLEASLVWPHVAESAWQSELTIGTRRETLGAFNASRLEARAELSRGVGPRMRVRLGHRFERSRTSDVSPVADAVLDDPEERVVLSAAFARLDYTSVDTPIEPQRGAILRLSTDLAAAVFGSDDSYLRSEMDVRLFHPWRSFVVAGRLHLGTTVPLGASRENEVPLTERFFAGGGDSVRGFEYQQLGPLDTTDEPLGGTSLFVTSLELRAPLAGRVGGVLFLDAGQVDLEPVRLRLSEIRYAAGVGLRIGTPIGPLRLDVAHLLNRPRNFDPVRLHLSVGHSF